MKKRSDCGEMAAWSTSRAGFSTIMQRFKNNNPYSLSEVS